MRCIRDDIMGMPIIVELITKDERIMREVFNYFISIDERFSTYKSESEIMCLNRKEVTIDSCSTQMSEVLQLAEQTSQATNGYFSIVQPNGLIDPSGIVKGWAIQNAAKLVESLGCCQYFIDAGGDIQSKGVDATGTPWTIGIRNPFNEHQIVKVIEPNGCGVATSGTSVRGTHIYNPHSGSAAPDEVVSLTVIGPNIYEADRFATGAFAMGEEGVQFIEALDGFEAYQIDQQGMATMTTGFNQYTV